jgi:hypothetical protein
VSDAERTPQERVIEDREALLDEREAVLDALQASLERVEDGHAAARAQAVQAREQARRIRLRSQRARGASQLGRAASWSSGGAAGDASAVSWRGRYPVGVELAGLADQLLSSADPHRAVRDVEDAASRLVPGVVASVMMLDAQGRLRVVEHTSSLAVELGEAQYEAGEGPCEDATRPGGPKLVRCDDLAAADGPWPRFGPVAVGLGVRSVVAVGLLPLSPARLGALHLYGREPGVLGDAEVDVAVVLAGYLAVTLVALIQVDRGHEQLGHLRRALDSRDVIGQAKGLVMAQRRVTADEAFELLAAASQRLNVKVRDIAEQVVRSRDL